MIVKMYRCIDCDKIFSEKDLEKHKKHEFKFLATVNINEITKMLNRDKGSIKFK